MKQICIAGNIGKDAETRTTPNGDKVTSWTVAVENRNGRDKSTFWFDCDLWGKRGETLAQYLTRGGKVTVSGELGKREHDGKTYLSIRVDNVALQGGKSDGGTYDGGQRDNGPQTGAGAGGRPSDDDGDSIPFAPEWRI